MLLPVVETECSDCSAGKGVTENILRDTQQYDLIMPWSLAVQRVVAGLRAGTLCSLCRGSSEEEAALKTNKQVYSLLLRATASKGLSLLERTELMLSLLEQLAPRSQGSPGGHWGQPCRAAAPVPCWGHRGCAPACLCSLRVTSHLCCSGGTWESTGIPFYPHKALLGRFPAFLCSKCQLGSCGDKNVTFAPWGNCWFFSCSDIHVLHKDVTSELLCFGI